MEEMSAPATSYAKLLSETQPEVVRNEEQNQVYIQKLEELTGRESVTPAEEKLIALLTLLVEEYEDKHYAVPQAGRSTSSGT